MLSVATHLHPPCHCSNGCLINGTLVKSAEVELRSGDEVQLGSAPGDEALRLWLPQDTAPGSNSSCDTGSEGTRSHHRTRRRSLSSDRRARLHEQRSDGVSGALSALGRLHPQVTTSQAAAILAGDA